MIKFLGNNKLNGMIPIELSQMQELDVLSLRKVFVWNEIL